MKLNIDFVFCSEVTESKNLHLRNEVTEGVEGYTRSIRTKGIADKMGISAPLQFLYPSQ